MNADQPCGTRLRIGRLYVHPSPLGFLFVGWRNRAEETVMVAAIPLPRWLVGGGE